jgi:hypothetical protein
MLQLERVLAPSEPARSERVVMIARDDHELARAERVTKRLEERTRALENLAGRAVAQLQRVAEQHEAIDALERCEKRVSGAVPA